MSLGGGGVSDNNCGLTNKDALHKAICKARDAGVTFTIDTSTGQLKYASDANGGSYSAATSWLKWKLEDLVSV